LVVRGKGREGSEVDGVKQMEAEENCIRRRCIISALIGVFRWSRLA
jgi:hypothetical protein